MMKGKLIDCDSRAGTTCQKYVLLEDKQIYLTEDNQESHELLPKQQARVLLFDFENSQSVDLREEKNDEEIQDKDREQIDKDSDVEWIGDVQINFASNRYPIRTEDVVGNSSAPVSRKKVVPRNSNIRKEKLTRMENFDDATVQLLRELMKQYRRRHPRHLGIKCQVCFVHIEKSHQRFDPWCEIIDHARAHIGKPSFRCSLCSYESHTRLLMYRHKNREHRDCIIAKWRLVERKMEPENLEELRLAMMLCLGCKRSDAATVGNSEENGVGKTTELQSDSRSESKSGDVEMSSCPGDVNVEKFDQTRCYLKNQRVSLCRELFYQNAAANGQSICQICMGRNIRASFVCKGAYGHVMDHANLPVYQCNMCSMSLHERKSIESHVRVKHHKRIRSNYTNRGDEFHDEIVEWIMKCFGSVESRA